MKKLLLCLIIFFCLTGTTRNAIARGNWFMTLYGAKYAHTKFLDIVFLQEKPDFNTSWPGFTNFNGSYLVALTAGKEFARISKFIGWEFEGQFVKHFKYQDHIELNALAIMRWLWFPWDKYLDTSIAVGEGVSYAFDGPRVEGNDTRDDIESVHFLNYLMVELSLTLPRFSHWSIIGRVHHRSDIYGLLGGGGRGSNFVGGGIKYMF